MSSKGFITKLAHFSRDIPDPYNKGFYTHFEVYVPKPTNEHPFPCVFVSIRNGHQRLFFRMKDVAEISKAFRVPRKAQERLKLALVKANHEADRLEAEDMLKWKLRRMAKGDKVVGMPNGEVLAEAEKFIDSLVD